MMWNIESSEWNKKKRIKTNNDRFWDNTFYNKKKTKNKRNYNETHNRKTKRE